MNPVLHKRATRDSLTRALEGLPDHLRPIVLAMRDYGIGFMFVPQVADAFRLPRDKRTTITVLGDDFDQAVGPEGFHMPSVRRAIRSSHAFAVVSSAPPPDVYSAMATTAAATRANVLLVETRPEQEIQWVNLIQKLAPGRFVWLATVEGGHA
ncbi:MAG: hypothetical protein IT550_15160 [Novosphingobium sp.]|nr:hypothetical protein [Novosphingobium sp.]